MTATWTDPRTWVTGDTVTASLLNTHIRDNLSWLKTPLESGRITWASDFTTSSTSFVDLTSATTTLTTKGGGLDVFLRVGVDNTSPGITTFQVVVDGTTTYNIGAVKTAAAGSPSESFLFEHIPALAAGSHTIKIQVKCNAGTSTIKGTTAATNDPLFFVREAGG